MEPQGEQAQHDLRHWDGSSPPEGYEDDPAVDGSLISTRKWRHLDAVYRRIAEDDFWNYLRQPGINLVRGQGPADAKIMIVGEAPGAVENGAGSPFAGSTGAILNQLIDLMAGKPDFRERCFLTNVLKYRPPGNATPNLAAMLHGQKALREEWGIVLPTLTIAVGATAHSALHPQGGIMTLSAARQAGQPWLYRRTTPHAPYRYCVSVWHPMYAVRQKDPAVRQRVMDQIERNWEGLGEWLREELPDVLA